MSKNSNLGVAKTAKNDEFYTQLSDIEKELKHYRSHFSDKIVLCNCDDPFESNFFKYFVLNFNRLGLKKLIATCYYSSPIVGQQLYCYFDKSGQMRLSYGDEISNNTNPKRNPKRPYKAIVTSVHDTTGDGGIDMVDVAKLFMSGENKLTELEGNGDFRSDECLKLLDEADIVVTNPPFSLFREYIATLMQHNKKFVVIGNQNAITYKEIFSFIMKNQLWLGSTSPKEFVVPAEIANRNNTYVREDGATIAKFGNVCWFTNLDLKKRHEEMILINYYNTDKYYHFDNYDAINVDKISDIPQDYSGIMGVPITFLDKYNPSQFEIVGYTAKDMGVDCLKFYKDLEQSMDGKPFVRNMKSARFSPMISVSERPKKTCYRASNANGYLLKTYGRVLLRNKHPEPPKEVK